MLLSLMTGICVGFLVAMPIGPIDVICIRSALIWGVRAGFIAGLGAACADAIYGAVAAFGILEIAPFLQQHARAFKLTGGLLLCCLGGILFRAKYQKEVATPKDLLYAFSTTFFLALLSPMTAISFLAAFALLSTTTETSTATATLLTLGVFMGSALWWLVLSSCSKLLRNTLTPQKLHRINQAAGLCLLAFGTLMLAFGLLHNSL